MNALQFIELVRRMRRAQKAIDDFKRIVVESEDVNEYDPLRIEGLEFKAKEIERMVDAAEISITVEVNRPGADIRLERDPHHRPAGIAGH